jgi:succinoglycan biosynthesis transport protein ExoP
MKQTRLPSSGPLHLVEDPARPLLLPGGPQSAQMRDVTENGFAILVRRHRRAAILFFAISVAAACLYARFAPKTYKVQTVLEIIGLNQDFMNIRDVSPTGSGIVDQTYIETQIRLLQNEAVTNRVIAAMAGKVPSSLAPSSEVEEALLRRILSTVKVKEEGASNLVRISLVGPDARLAADTANELSQQYIEEEQNARTSQAAETNTFLRQQLDQARAKLQNSEKSLQDYARDSGIVLTDDTHESVASEHLREVQQGLAQAEVDLATRQAQLDVARHTSGDSLPEVVNDPIIREDQNKLRDLRGQLADLSTTMTPQNYKVQKVQAQIHDLENELTRHRNTIVERLTMEQRQASRRQTLLEEQYRRQLLTVMDQGGKQVHYNMLRHEADVDRQIYQSMVQRVKEAGVMAALRAPNARVVLAAIPPSAPTSPNLVTSLLLSLLFAAVATVLYILIAERRDRSLRSPGQTELFLPNAELAAIPRARLTGRRVRTGILALDKTGAHRCHPMLKHWTNQEGTVLSEAFRMAGTSILLRTEGGAQSRVLLITSPHPQCGKTMSVANLAVSLAEGSRRVAIVDGDLRKSGLSHLFGYEASPGLSENLAETRTDDPLTLLRSTDFAGVWILPSGTVRENAAKLLQSNRLGSIIETLRAEFHFVLLDGPPLLGFADARLLGKYAEGTILICRAGRTEREELNEAWSILREDGATVLGTILNAYDLKTERPSRYRTYLGYTGKIS